MAKTVRIGTRGSKLALWQANYVKAKLMHVAPQYDYEVCVVRTKGDKMQDVALSRIGDKGLFTKELEQELMDGNVDICVHSMKDMPTVLPDGLAIMGVPERASALDCLVGVQGATLANLPAGARVATGSLRRVAQIRRNFPKLACCEIRGNIDTRIARVENGEFDAAVLAVSGLARLGLGEHLASIIPPTQLVPAAGQGALAMEGRADNLLARSLCQAATDEMAWRAVAAERRIMHALEGGCQVPFGAYAREEGVLFVIDAFVASVDGRRHVAAHAEGLPGKSLQLADDCIKQLARGGAGRILQELR